MEGIRVNFYKVLVIFDKYIKSLLLKVERWKTGTILYFLSHEHFLSSFLPNLGGKKIVGPGGKLYPPHFLSSPSSLQPNSGKLQFLLPFNPKQTV